MEKPSPSLYVGCMNVLNTAAHVLMGGAAFFGLVIGDAYPSKLTAHSFLIVIGLTILCSQAILSVNPYKGFNENFKFPKKSKMYWIIQIIACTVVFIGATLGIAAVGDMTVSLGPINVGAKHFYSSHGVIGLIVMIFVSVKLVGALANLFLADRLSTLMKTIHVIVSTITISMAYITISIKYGDVNDKYWSSPSWAIAFSVFTMIALLLMTVARVLMTGSIKF
ncbi:uncharacterized protein LOC118266509 [Spodoptera frugiperda]|uniref:Uncharacterized protein LOC118266509 n=1 Tax=Spodoptera frugiperda TaxID=7108 RepID=A0A9R0EHX7_SPOFR|nr:uncharacterized protein LOC118266509 [Spodoptera frugiperda]